jgi:asparagine synthase (glutamine-hydrolysing)
MKIPFSSIAKSPDSKKFIGYWGYGNKASLEEMFNLLLSRAGAHNWEKVSHITISASGLSQEADAWVRIGDNSLTLGRQTFGRMPLYWLQREEVIWFAPRLQLLLSLISFPKISIEGLYGYSCFSYVPTPLSPIEQIHSLSAGTEQTWRGDGVGRLLAPQLQSNWEWEEETEQIDREEEAIATRKEVLSRVFCRVTRFIEVYKSLF